MESAVCIGVDVGQKVDPTAIVVVEAARPAGTRETFYTARTIQRLPLGTPYPEIGAAIAGVVLALQARGVVKPRIVVDSTGVGAPVVDIFREALRGKAHTLIAATFTHGDRYFKDTSAGTASVGKAHLVSRLQALLQTARLQLPITPESQVLARELQDYEIRVTGEANDKYGAFKVGAHDDLVTALGLAVLDDPIREAESRRLQVW